MSERQPYNAYKTAMATVQREIRDTKAEVPSAVPSLVAVRGELERAVNAQFKLPAVRLDTMHPETFEEEAAILRAMEVRQPVFIDLDMAMPRPPAPDDPYYIGDGATMCFAALLSWTLHLEGGGEPVVACFLGSNFPSPDVGFAGVAAPVLPPEEGFTAGFTPRLGKALMEHGNEQVIEDLRQDLACCAGRAATALATLALEDKTVASATAIPDGELRRRAWLN